MDLQNLKEHHEELLSFMENNGYSSTYIRRFREEINRILAKADSHDWQSYRDVYLDYLEAPHSKDYLRNKRTIIGELEQFDDFGRMPDGRSRHTLFERGSYHLLCSEFRELIDFYRIYEKKRGKKESTIRGEALNTASFLHQMQQRGAQCLDAILEEDVLSFFLVEGGSLQRSCSYKKNIAAVFKAGLNWKAAQCRKVLSFLPVLRENRKNIQYLTQDEVRLLFSSGIRTNEVRLLLRENVDLKRGILDIQYSKGHDQHYIVLHDSMLEIMRRYDAAINGIVPEREYFFPSIRNSHFNRGWVTKNFNLLWRKANTSHATAYEFRHHYAVTNLNQWTGYGFECL